MKQMMPPIGDINLLLKWRADIRLLYVQNPVVAMDYLYRVPKEHRKYVLTALPIVERNAIKQLMKLR